MSSQVETAHIRTFSANVYHLAQQKKSRLRPVVPEKSQRSKFDYQDRIGLVEPVEVTSRHMDTPLTEVPHSRRRSAMVDFVASEVCDEEDLIRMLIEPKSEYAEAFSRGMGRRIDRAILRAYYDTVYEGEEGGTAITWPAAQTIAVNYVESGSAANSGLTMAKLRRARAMLDDAEGNDDGDRLVLACTAFDYQKLLQDPQVTSADYQSMRALENGTLDDKTLMGFRPVRIQDALMPKNGSNHRRVLAFVASGMRFVVGKEPTTQVLPDPTKNGNPRIITKATFGAVRMEEVKCVEILVDPAA